MPIHDLDFIEKIHFGNPTMEQVKFLLRSNYLDGLTAQIKANGLNRPASNASEQTYAELLKLAETTEKLENDPELKSQYKERYLSEDRALIAGFKQLLVANKVDNIESAHNMIDNIIQDTLPLITKLKFFFQRPRPYQLAFEYGIPMYYHASVVIDSPSYPSGHAFMGRLLSLVIANKYPSLGETMANVTRDFNFSRIFMGVHYKSDIDFGVGIADLVFNDIGFARTYQLR